MNNDAKDVIGKLRSINVTLLLMHIRHFEFPLDAQLQSLLSEHRSRLLKMVQLVDGLARFGHLKQELQSSIDDIVDQKSEAFYTQDCLDMILSLYCESSEIRHIKYSDDLSVMSFLADTCRLLACGLLQSVIWLRIGFGICYPNAPLMPLRQGWLAFCEIVSEFGGDSLSVSAIELMTITLRNWRWSETVVMTLETGIARDTPHGFSFLQSVREVDAILENC